MQHLILLLQREPSRKCKKDFEFAIADNYMANEPRMFW